MKLTKTINKRIDELEQVMAEGVANGTLINVECELEHRFNNGFYERTITMERGLLICSKIHLSRHEFVISKGVVAVKVNDGKWNLLEAPYYGWTMPNTRRVLFIIETATWTTYHRLEEGETTPEQVEARIIKKHNHPYIEMKKQMEVLT